MEIIPRPVFPPGQCIASLASEDPKGFIDTLLTPSMAEDNRIIVSVSWVEECARKLGFADAERVEELEEAVRVAEDRALQLEQELEEADKFADAAEYTLSRFGQKIQKKPGRPAKAA